MIKSLVDRSKTHPHSFQKSDTFFSVILELNDIVRVFATKRYAGI